MRKLLWPVVLIVLAAIFNSIHSFSDSAPASSASTKQQSNEAELSEHTHSEDIYQRTQATHVANYLRQHQRLPKYYLTRHQAREQGWNPRQGNLCDTLPGKAIGGDRFSNREQRLPEKQGRKWFEADVNYSCGHRSADRMLWSNDGLIYLTTDHYRSFSQLQ